MEKIAVGDRGMVYVGTCRGLRDYLFRVKARRRERALERYAERCQEEWRKREEWEKEYFGEIL